MPDYRTQLSEFPTHQSGEINLKRAACLASVVLCLSFLAVTTATATGLIIDYPMFLNQTSAGAEDRDFGFSLTYKNMAALDGVPDKGSDFA